MNESFILNIWFLQSAFVSAFPAHKAVLVTTMLEGRFRRKEIGNTNDRKKHNCRKARWRFRTHLLLQPPPALYQRKSDRRNWCGMTCTHLRQHSQYSTWQFPNPLTNEEATRSSDKNPPTQEKDKENCFAFNWAYTPIDRSATTIGKQHGAAGTTSHAPDTNFKFLRHKLCDHCALFFSPSLSAKFNINSA